MPIIGKVGRRSKTIILLNICIHLILIAGGITMIYPFLIMLSGSVKSTIDFKYFDIIPRYFSDDTVLFQKHLSTKYAWFSIANDCLNEQLTSFENIKPPEEFPAQRVRDWDMFLDSVPKEMDHYYYGIGAISELGVQPEMQRAFKRWLKERYHNSLDRLNEDLGIKLLSWEEISFEVYETEVFTERDETGNYRGILARLQEFKEKKVPRLYRYYFSLDGAFQTKLRRKYAGNLTKLNHDLGTDFEEWKDIHLSRTKPEGRMGELWEAYVRKDLNLQFIIVSDSALGAYNEFLKSKYHGDIHFLNKVYETGYSSFGEIPLVKKVPSRGNVLVDWAEFVESKVPVEFLTIKSAEFFYRDFLRRKYKTIDELNHAHGKYYQGFDTVNIPAKEWEWTLFKDNKRHILWEFIKRNYIVVLDTIMYNGRSVQNTFVYCFLSILATLIVNPMAAYALSRYRPASTYKILLFLMLTMAFPEMVLGIPQFLLMKKLGLLNTYAALILPGLTSGYLIFLLKGFFDSLPRELFECASIDGASEWTMFWQITMSLSKPILAVLALGAFTAAYGNFMMAFIVCQDMNMWTLMVHLYQLQQRSSQAVAFASLVIAAIPTFLIFISCQKIILQGIVVPTEK